MPILKYTKWTPRGLCPINNLSGWMFRLVLQLVIHSPLLDYVVHKNMWVLFGSLFMFFNFYLLDSHNKTCVAIANLWWCVSKPRTFLDLVMLYQKCWFLKWIHRSSHMCSLLSGEKLIKSKDIKLMPLQCLVFHPHRTTNQSSIGARLRKVTE